MIYERNVVDDNVNKQMLDLLLQMKLAKDGELMLATLKKFQMIEGSACSNSHAPPFVQQSWDGRDAMLK